MAVDYRLPPGVFLGSLHEPFWGSLLGEPVPGVSAVYPVRLWLVFVEGLLAFVMIKSLCTGDGVRRRRPYLVLWGWLVGFAIVSAFAIFQYLSRYQLHPYWLRANPNLVRSNATLDDPNALAAYLLLGIGLAVGMAWSVRHESPARFRVACLLGLLGALALLTTASRSATGAFLLTAVAAMAFEPPRFLGASRVVRWGARATVLCFVGVLAVSVLMRGTVEDRSNYMPSGPMEAWARTLDPRVPVADILEHRQVWWSGGLKMFVEHPLLGVGLGRFPKVLPEYEPDAPALENAHNIPLQILAETGILGLALFAALGCMIVAALAQAAYGNHRRAAPLAYGMLLGVLAFGITLVSGNALLLSSVQVLLAIPLAAVIVASMDAAGEREA
jgi:O-antigen ligase